MSVYYKLGIALGLGDVKTRREEFEIWKVFIYIIIYLLSYRLLKEMVDRIMELLRIIFKKLW